MTPTESHHHPVGRARPAPRHRLAVVIPNFQGGGAERVVLHLLREIDRAQFDVVLVVGRLEGAFASQLDPDVEVVELGHARSRSAIPALWRALRTIRPDVVLSTLGFNLAVLVLKPFLLRHVGVAVRIANTVSVEESGHARGKQAALRLLQKRLYRRADVIICQSTSMADDVRAYLELDPARIQRLYNPVDSESILARADGPDPFGPRQGETRILAVGKLDHQKGFDLLLPAFAQVYQENPTVRLTILGDGADRPALNAQISDLGLDEVVHMPGFVDNPYVWMRHADLFALSSRFEGFANVLIEALALGLPAVAFDAPGGMDEVITEGENGWLAPAEDVDAFAAALRRGLAQRDGLDMEAEAAAVRRRFALPAITRSYEQALMNALAHASPSS